MAVFEEQFDNHPIHDLLLQLDAAASQKFKQSLSSEAVDRVDRIKQGGAFIRSRLDTASPVLNSVARLNGLQKGVQTALNELNGFSSDGNDAHLTNASNNLDGPISTAATLPGISDNPPTISSQDAISFKRLAENVIDELREKVRDGKMDQATLTEHISELSSRNEVLAQQLSNLESGISSKLQELESQFKSAETERQNEFEEAQKTQEQQFNSVEDDLTKESSEIVKSLNDKLQDASKIVNLVGNVGLTGNFKGAGETERNAANQMRSIAFYCFIGSFLVIAVTLFLTAIEGFDPWSALFRMFAAAFLLIPGAYAAKESASHRALENRHRKSELELASIGAYLSDLPEDKRHQLKADLTSNFFGQNLEDGDDKIGDVPPSSLVGLLKDAINALSKR